MYRWNILMAIIFSQFFNIVALIGVVGYHADMFMVEALYSVNGYFFFYVLAYSAYFLGNELKTLNFYQLPVSVPGKYLTVLGSWFAFIVCSILFSVVAEALSAAVAMVFSPDVHINIGGYIRYLCGSTSNASPLFLLACICWTLAMLIRNKNVMAIIIGVVSVLSFFFVMGRLREYVYSTSQSALFYVIGLGLIVVSYYIFKRWQPANNGFLMI